MGRILIGADGPRSTVAARVGLDQNKNFLAGAEWLVEGVPIEKETFFLVMNHELAPGYCMWLAPHGEMAALGVAGHRRKFQPHRVAARGAKAIWRRGGYEQMRVVKRKGGTIPVGGRLRRVYRADGVRALLLGDAAGLCGAATGGGIYPALISGRLAAQAVANEILNGVPGAIKTYLRDLPHAGRLGHRCRSRIGCAGPWTALAPMRTWVRSMASLALRKAIELLQRTLLETPIISMDSGFFKTIRLLLSKHPASMARRCAWPGSA